MDPRRSAARLREVTVDVACPLCGGGVTTSWIGHTFDYGSGETAVALSVTVPVCRCDACEFDFLDETAERLRHEAVCEHLGVLSPTAIRRIREGHEMTRAQFARVTGLGEASLNRWENGLNIQTHANDRYLRLLELPGIMRVLRKLGDSKAPSPVASELVGERFRVLQVTGALLKRQASFRLRRAA